MSTTLCEVSDFQECEAREFQIGDQNLILVNWHGSWYAYRNICPHAKWPLNIQPDVFFDSDEQFLQCSNHMALFDIETGVCKAGPCVGDSLAAVRVKVIENQVLVEL